MWTLQVVEPYRKEEEARRALDYLAKQSGFLGGTARENLDGVGVYVQAFFRADPPEYATEQLPDGTKHVFMPTCLREWYGIES